ncbi:unnamed protein product [Adineta ricciae]|uniref:Uncharacterized protein n=1 Tax=Adineta ricciae TaxID=249248 RepID=A0A815HG50_ADIRI|nr:unnamed protein product [Adineta ricciae]CAF1577085.1 unnamed protein product [Adineta ricciae]
MDSPIFRQWLEWEARVQEWLNQSEDCVEFMGTTPVDRLMLTILTVKYHILYRDMDEENRSATANHGAERIATIRLFKTKPTDVNEKDERHRDREKIFDNLTGRLLTPQQVITETSVEWQEFNELCDWHGIAFVERFRYSLHQFISDLISTNALYQELIRKPRAVSPVKEINNEVYNAKKEGVAFISVDIKSANFGMLQYIGAIDPQIYPTWSDFLLPFVGAKKLFVENKKLRQFCLGKLPQYYKLEALWKQYTGTIYRTVLCNCFDEKEVDLRCVALSGDEIVFQLDPSMKNNDVIDFVDYIRNRLVKESPIVKFSVQAYRIQAFHWREKHLCFARMFIGESEKQFDLKCVPDRSKNYETAYQDFCSLLNDS